MIREAKDIFHEIDMKVACFIDMLKNNVEASELTIFINESDYEIFADFGCEYIMINNPDFSRAVFNSYKGIPIEICPHLKDIQIGIRLIMPGNMIEE